MNRYSSEPDKTAVGYAMPTGLTIRRTCWVCNKPKPSQGGMLDKRTRMWRCAACAGVKK